MSELASGSMSTESMSTESLSTVPAPTRLPSAGEAAS